MYNLLTVGDMAVTGTETMTGVTALVTSANTSLRLSEMTTQTDWFAEETTLNTTKLDFPMDTSGKEGTT